MIYVQAKKPEKHNGGVFYEHEIHFDHKGDWQSRTALKRTLIEFLNDNLGNKHTDYRVSFMARGTTYTNTWLEVKVRFADKNKAMRFKLAWVE